MSSNCTLDGIPSVETLENLERILPGATDRIFKIIENDRQAAIRAREEYSETVLLHEKYRYYGSLLRVISALIASVIFGVGSFIVVMGGHDVAGTTALGVLGVGLVNSLLGVQSRKVAEEPSNQLDETAGR